MNTIDGRINGQSAYQPANQSRAAWREEMLGQFLNQMRERQPTEQTKANEPLPTLPKTDKGNFINIYV
ncbi:MAG: hypothetical protein LBT86_00625 [Deltaproteobacteria bacterium]|jgi:hypothetical protein|nr:hypothetical protein [Deltaproteobacteria bacterium]